MDDHLLSIARPTFLESISMSHLRANDRAPLVVPPFSADERRLPNFTLFWHSLVTDTDTPDDTPWLVYGLSSDISVVFGCS